MPVVLAPRTCSERLRVIFNLAREISFFSVCSYLGGLCAEPERNMENQWTQAQSLSLRW